MNFSLEKNEHYTLLQTNLLGLVQAQVEELTEMVKQELSNGGAKYLIINFESIKECNAAAVRELINLGKYLATHKGMLIISCMNDQFTRLLDKAEIIFVPSDMEAIDYIFMDQLEKQFLSDNSEN
ncbi:MAG: hypothetical protein H7296_01700 [Bacteroidia bacterium]|nr:hypothetical protein [Bacteroidia bacterium]